MLRDQGFGPAVRALADQLGMENRIQIELQVEPAQSLTEHAQVAIFQIIREAFHQAIRRGPPTRVRVASPMLRTESRPWSPTTRPVSADARASTRSRSGLAR